MIIGIDASRANRKIKTGVEWYSWHLLKNLYKLKTNHQFFLYTDSKFENELKAESKFFKEKVLSWPLPRFWTMGRLSLEMLKKRPDVLFVPAHTLPFIGGKKNVITWHDVGYERYPETYTAWELTSLKQGASRAFKKADKIITISEFTKKEIMERYDVPDNKLRVIYLGCNHERWKPFSRDEVQPLLSRLELTLPYFIYVGRLALRKNIVGLIRAYNFFREKYKQPHNLLLVGSAGPLQDEIDEEINHSPFKDEIKKLGWLEMKDVPALVSQARALVYPSIYEGFGLPVIEAMAGGCPVIASTSGSLPEIIGSAGLLIDAHDVEGFADAMHKVITDLDLRQRLIEAGAKRSAEFSWEKCASQTLEVLESV